MAIEETIPKFKAEINTPVKNKGQMKIKRSLFWILVLIAIVGAYGSWHYYNKYKTLTADPNAEAEKMTKQLVEVLGKLMELPANETPTVATISDKNKLAGQAFFVNAEDGDILFAYTTAMKAILYRPSTNKIINVAPITINQGQNLETSTKQLTEENTVRSVEQASTTKPKR